MMKTNLGLFRSKIARTRSTRQLDRGGTEMTYMSHFPTLRSRRDHLKDVLDAADSGRPASIQRHDVRVADVARLDSWSIWPRSVTPMRS